MRKIILFIFISLFSFLLWQIKPSIPVSWAQAEPEIPGGAWICWIDAKKLTDTDLQYIASHYDVYRDQNGSLTKEQIDRLHQLNPNFIILKYKGHSAICGQENWGPLVEEHPEWWLRAKGNEIVHWLAESCKVLKPNLQETREFVWEQYQEQLVKGYDGIFADVSGPMVIQTNFQPHPIIDPDPQRGGDYTQGEWISDQIGRLKFLKQRLGEKLHLWNPIPSHWNEYKNTKDFWDKSESDGAQFDGFLNKRTVGEEGWREAVGILINAIKTKPGQIILVKTKNLDESLTERKRVENFSFASYLLAISSGNDRSAYFCYCYDRETELPSMVEDTRPQVKLGKPIQDSTIDGFKIPNHRSYRRNFEYGTVLVNPTADRDENIDLGGNYYDDAVQIKKVSLSAHSAKILTKVPQEKKFSLSSGWNKITWPDISGYTAKTALEDIDNDCGAGTSVAISRKRKDWWEDFVKNYGGENFNLQNEQNYFINVTKACTWTL